MGVLPPLAPNAGVPCAVRRWHGTPALGARGRRQHGTHREFLSDLQVVSLLPVLLFVFFVYGFGTVLNLCVEGMVLECCGKEGIPRLCL